jgi:lipopolysaccharide/colanic/teichoic acid biosynthesis glycosyltransferase
MMTRPWKDGACDVYLCRARRAASAGSTGPTPLSIYRARRLGIKLEGRSPSILLQRRAAFNGREFAVYNFTTTAWEGACIGQARRNDSRVTRVGRLLRATGMDELPQLFSVLGGQMSLVGPRPHAVDPKGEFSDPIARYATQHHIKPGIIGWAPREATQVEQLSHRVDFERWYIDNWSIWLDLRILLRFLVGEWV